FLPGPSLSSIRLGMITPWEFPIFMIVVSMQLVFLQIYETMLLLVITYFCCTHIRRGRVLKKGLFLTISINVFTLVRLSCRFTICSE
ncbi:MAG TPA: hypothetical protein VMV56_12670, partial [Williamwhitmania sp.]|nr:hypothetical protein [Williamwhitmania sp.]